MRLGEEAARATELLRGRIVKRVMRPRDREVVIEFEDGARFFADSATLLALSITGSGDEDIARP